MHIEYRDLNERLMADLSDGCLLPSTKLELQFLQQTDRYS